MATVKTTDITVRYAAGAYVTNTVDGQGASCTHSAKEAANRLSRKLYSDGFQRAKQVPGGSPTTVSVWRLHGSQGESYAVL